MIDDEINPVLGIDLGTTYSAIARWNRRGPEAYQINTPAGESLQSVVYYDPKLDEFIVGNLAYRKGIVNPENVVVGVKRLMDNGVPGDRRDRRQKVYPVQISAKILEYIHQDVAKRYPGNKFKSRGTIVTVPYYFKAHQCAHTQEAAKIANIHCIGILQEPIAASLSYAWQKFQEDPESEYAENVLVFDLGGGTFDLTLFRLQQTPEKLDFEVLGTGGDDRLGGMDFDQALADLLLKKGNISLSGLSDKERMQIAQQKLFKETVQIKHDLSYAENVDATVPFIFADQSIETEVSRTEFEAAIQDYLDKIESIIDKLWDLANFKPEQVDRVILVGGSSKIPRIRQFLEDYIHSDKIYANINPSLCVAEGAAMYAIYHDDRSIFNKEIEIRTRTSHSLGIEVANGRFQPIIRANRQAPVSQKQAYTNHVDNATAIEINVYQGEDTYVAKNSKVGTIAIDNLPPKPAGQLDILVEFNVDEEQMLSVTVEVKQEGGSGIKKSDSFNFA
jgi:molecular chaperone DnaK